MAVCGDQGVVSVAIEEVPESLVKDGRVTSFETMAEVIRDAARENKINAKDCALALHSRDVFTRRITVPAMTKKAGPRRRSFVNFADGTGRVRQLDYTRC